MLSFVSIFGSGSFGSADRCGLSLESLGGATGLFWAGSFAFKPLKFDLRRVSRRQVEKCQFARTTMSCQKFFTNSNFKLHYFDFCFLSDLYFHVFWPLTTIFDTN